MILLVLTWCRLGIDLVSTWFRLGVHLCPLVSTWCPLVSTVVSTWFRRGFDINSNPHVLGPCGLENIYNLNPSLTVKINFDLISRSKILNIIKSTESLIKYCTYSAVVDR